MHTKQKDEKLVQKGLGLAHVTYFFNFGTPVLSPVTMKLQTSNFADGSTVRNTKQRNEKLVEKGAWPRSRDLLLNFWTPLLSSVTMKIQKSNFAGD